MKITPGHIILPVIAAIAGALLIYAGMGAGWGSVGAAGGVFFITLGAGAALLTLAWMLPGPAGAFLKHPVVSILILCAVLGTMCLTVILGIANLR